ncbi:MAG: AAA family ATPase [Nanoarchaeota archaeon]
MGEVIGIISLKGGVGKTSIVASLGDAIASFGKKVLLVDGNLSAPNLGLHFNIVDPEISLHHVLSRVSKPLDAVQGLEKCDILPASIHQKSAASPLKLKDSIYPLKKSYDFILLDSSPSLNDETLGVMLASDKILVVSTPDHPTLNNTIKAVKLARQRGTPIIGLILNKVYGKNFEIPISQIEKTLDLPVMAVIPHETDFLKSLSEFESLVGKYPKSKAGEEFLRLASVLVGEKYRGPKLRGFVRWLAPKRQDVNRALYYDGLFS